MPYCPNCGGHVSVADTECSECGESIGPGFHTGQDGRDHREQSEQAAERTEPEGPIDAEQLRELRARSDRTGQVDPGQRREADRQSRRTVIKRAMGVLGLMIVGAYGVERLSGNGPEAALAEWRAAWEAGDSPTVRALWHPDASEPIGSNAGYLALDPTEGLEYWQRERTVREASGTEAVIEEEFVLDHESFEERRRVRDVITLGLVDGEWRIRSIRTQSVESAAECRIRFTLTGSRRLYCP